MTRISCAHPHPTVRALQWCAHHCTPLHTTAAERAGAGAGAGRSRPNPLTHPLHEAAPPPPRTCPPCLMLSSQSAAFGRKWSSAPLLPWSTPVDLPFPSLARPPASWVRQSPEPAWWEGAKGGKSRAVPAYGEGAGRTRSRTPTEIDHGCDGR